MARFYDRGKKPMPPRKKVAAPAPRKTYGNSEWGRLWMSTLLKMDFSNRLPPGRVYAESGLVTPVRMIEGRLTATVDEPTQQEDYQVKVRLANFGEAGNEWVRNQIQNNPEMAAAIRNKELPKTLTESCTHAGLVLLPRSWHEFEASCTCPDRATIPCKHLSAVLYLAANEMDKNPQLLFELHGLDLFEAAGGKRPVPRTPRNTAPAPEKKVPEVAAVPEALISEPEPVELAPAASDVQLVAPAPPSPPPIPEAIAAANYAIIVLDTDGSFVSAALFNEVDERLMSFDDVSQLRNYFVSMPQNRESELVPEIATLSRVCHLAELLVKQGSFKVLNIPNTPLQQRAFDKILAEVPRDSLFYEKDNENVEAANDELVRAFALLLVQ